MLLLCFAQHVLAVGSGGFNNEVVSAAALGKGNASVAQTDNATSLYFNPANVGRLERRSVSLGVTWERLGTEMKDPARGISEDMEDQDALTPQIAYGMPVGNGDWAWGISLVAPFGLRTEWSGTGFSKYIATESEAAFADIVPVVAYDVNDKVTLGAGLDIFVAMADLKRKVPNSALHAGLTGSLVPLPDGDSQIDGDGTGLGVNLGARIDISERHAVGIAYRSEADVDLDGDIKLSGLAGASAAAFGGTSFRADAETEITLPQSVTVGYAFRPNDSWIVEIDLQWTGWSSYDELGFTFNPSHPLLAIDNPQPKNWDDTWTVGTGAEYLLSEKLALRFGYYYYETPIPEETFDTVVPDNDRHNITVGLGYSWNDQATLDAAYVLVMPDDRTVDNNVGASSGSSVDGTYESLHHLLAVGFSYAF
jgi:long-chain fatty acid transport protein